MQIIKEQFQKINHFLLILIPLFIVNAIFNLKYDWGGISTIARVYIMVLSFYIIFIFSQIDIDEYRASYAKLYGWKGKYYLFNALILFPFIFIYFLTIVFTIINYLDAPNWPIEPSFRLLDGRYSNTVIYPLILFVALKLKKRPGISIPLFIIGSIFYYAADHSLYSIFEPGIGVTIIKFTKYCIFIFILVYVYSKSRWRLLESIFLSIVSGSIIFAAVTSYIIVSFIMSKPGSTSLTISGNILLKAGITFPLEKLKNDVIENGTSQDIENIFIYFEKYKIEKGYTSAEIEKIIQRSRIGSIEYIFSYLNKKNIKLNFKFLENYAVSQLSDFPSDPAYLNEFTKHFGSYYIDNKNDFFTLYKSGNKTIKITILKSLAYTDDVDAVNFLINKITSVEKLYSDTAYNSLKIITGKDPAAELKKDKFDFDVVLFFRNYASGMDK